MSEIKPIIKLNHIHKRLMVIYHLSDMRQVWKKVRSDWKKEFKEILPKRFGKYPETWNLLNEWVEVRIKKHVSEGGQDIIFHNKADLKDRGWDDKLIFKLYPKPDKIVYLGRGRHAYFYNGQNIDILEDSEEFIEYISAKMARKQKLIMKKKLRDDPRIAGFGAEFIR